METQLSCPLGHKCEDARDGVLHRCAWFVTLAGENPVTKEAKDSSACAIFWLPTLLIETGRTARGTTAAVESLRNIVAGETPGTPQLTYKD